MTKSKWITIFEVSGSVLAMAYALLIASNTGNEILGFSLLLISALLFGAWGFIDKDGRFSRCNFLRGICDYRHYPLVAVIRSNMIQLRAAWT